jgi:hypothetical protein
MWSSRRKRTAAPSMLSQTSRNRVSSSDHAKEKPMRFRVRISTAMTTVIAASTAAHSSSTARQSRSAARLARPYTPPAAYCR